MYPVKRHRGEPGHTRAHGHTDEPHNHPNPPTHPSDRETTESAADSTAAAPEPTAPRGRLGGRPLRTRHVPGSHSQVKSSQVKSSQEYKAHKAGQRKRNDKYGGKAA